jgi:spore maturation protein CgeB
MRIQNLTTVNPNYIDQFYCKEQGTEPRSYEAMLADLLYDAHGWSDFLSVALRKHGIEMEVVVGNAPQLQQQWAIENGLTYAGENWKYEIVAAQIAKYRPDILFLTDYWNYPAEFITHIRSICPMIRAVIVWCGAPFRDSSIFSVSDLVLSCIPDLVDQFRSLGRNSELLDHAFEPRILERLNLDSDPLVEFVFLGSIVLRSQFHLERERLLSRLIDQVDIEIWSDLTRIGCCDRARLNAMSLAYDMVNLLRWNGVSESLLDRLPVLNRVLKWKERPAIPRPVNRRLLSHTHPPLFGLKMFQKIHESKLVLNKHIDISARSSSNLRLYEVTGVGSCLITDWKKDIGRNFEPDKEIITYRTAEECLEKVSYLLDNEDKRREIALAGQRRTLRDHTFDQRAPQLISYIQSVV